MLNINSMPEGATKGIASSWIPTNVYERNGQLFLRLNDDPDFIKSKSKLVFSIGTVEEEILRIGRTINKFDTLGVNLVAATTNELLSHTAKPLSFFGHYSCYTSECAPIGSVMKGFAEGCSLAQCAMFASDGVPKALNHDECSLVVVAIGVYIDEFDNRHDVGFGDYAIAIPSNGMTFEGLSLLLKSMKKSNGTVKDVSLFSDNVISSGEDILMPANVNAVPIVASIKEGKIKNFILASELNKECSYTVPPYLAIHLDADKMCMSPFLKWIATERLTTDEELAKLYIFSATSFLIVDKKHGDEIESRLKTINAKIVGEIEQRTPPNSEHSVIIDKEKWVKNLRGEAPPEDITMYDERPTAIMKLKYDHLEEIFDWLSFWDLIAVAETCKRLQQMAGYYFQQNYRTHYAHWVYGGILSPNNMNLNIFSKFVQRLSCFYNEWSPTYYNDAMDFVSVKNIMINQVFFRGDSHLKHLLCRLEIVQLHDCVFSVEFHQNFLRYCTNVKHLRIGKCTHGELIGTDNSWLLRDYPTLERVEIMPHEGSEEIPELVHFLERHTNIKHFATNVLFILVNKDLLLDSGIRLDVLSCLWQVEETPITYVDALNELYEKGIFKHLHLVGREVSFDQDVADQIAPVHGLKKFMISFIDDPEMFILPCTPTLKELVIENISEIEGLDAVARNLVNLERLEINNITREQMLTFIGSSTKLNNITVKSLSQSSPWADKVIDLVELNKEREKLAITRRAQKVMVFVSEAIYLPTKWAHENIHLTMIELWRKGTCDILHDSFDDFV